MSKRNSRASKNKRKLEIQVLPLKKEEVFDRKHLEYYISSSRDNIRIFTEVIDELQEYLDIMNKAEAIEKKQEAGTPLTEEEEKQIEDDTSDIDAYIDVIWDAIRYDLEFPIAEIVRDNEEAIELIGE